MARTITTKNNKKITLLNPAEKGKKYAKELKNKKHYLNANGFRSLKKSDDGKEIKLTKAEASYRMGYLAARKDSANAYKAKKRKKS